MDNYVFIRVVGKGSYGEVNLVKHRTDRKQYVIKKLNLTTSSKRERRAAEQEAQLLSQLRHPNIVTYRESWEGADLQLYIVMGFCEGGDLYHRLKQQKGELLPERQVVEWFVQIAMALQYLHERNILHRDLKTQNIFLTKTNIIKVGDLGIARVLENQNDMASTLIGTPYYMSPELFSNKPYNYKSDVWALGCCVYEMSTLKHAFNAKDMNSLVYRIVEGRLPQMPSKYDPQLGELIKSMLCKRPEDRPDVKLILRQPYIKRQIAMFLEATKEKTAKSRKNAVGDLRNNNAASVVPPQPKPERLSPNPQPEPLLKLKQKEKLQHHKNLNGPTDGNPVQITPKPHKPSSPDVPKSSITPLATVSNVQIDMHPQEDADVIKRQMDAPQAGKKEASLLPTHKKPPLKCVPDRRQGDERKVSNGFEHIHPLRDTFSVPEKKAADDEKDDTMELLKEANIPNPKLEEAALESKTARVISMENTGGNTVNENGKRSPAQQAHIQERPLSARERRRLRQSQDTTCHSAAVRAPCDVTTSKAQRGNAPVTSSISDFITETTKREKLLERRSDEEECGSSTSSTEHSEGDGRERRAESKDMQELVHMMTQTLRMVGGDGANEVDNSEFGSTASPEFKLNRKYRDTLVLHGKARQEAENLSLGEIPIGSSSGPAKIRRAIELLRTDVVKGLGVKLLDKVLEIMEEEDDIKRELCLRQQMGDEKYQAYAVMVRQLKFFEEIAFKV
ncbi:serine/threonine-protein kinase Nek4 isoform X8 [Dunckerocampus dactyliophorus]|uniref:serine/threonine-protein kinase Nek4 isoform X8 n=1 Tax=Dunckerocampus dactyliophorus TaxID=161453 RepID=UPI0024060B8F|nr:serine/threonine-protein kinase Nek4 isoform X8 [Dunckerocampus dactyliophorus]